MTTITKLKAALERIQQVERNVTIDPRYCAYQAMQHIEAVIAEMEAEGADDALTIAYLSGVHAGKKLQPEAEPCQHSIADARNPAVQSGYICVKCGALFAAADHPQPKAEPVQEPTGVFGFLLGRNALDGAWYGEIPDGKTRYWWRQALIDAMGVLSAAPQAATVREPKLPEFFSGVDVGKDGAVAISILMRRADDVPMLVYSEIFDAAPQAKQLTDEQIEKALAAWFDPDCYGFNSRMRAAIRAAFWNGGAL